MMGHKTSTMIGAVAALAAGSAFAGPMTAQAPAAPVAASYAELLQPIPNAVERLRLSDAEAGSRPAGLTEVQYHHHHHHHHHSRAWYRSNGYIWSGGGWVLRPVHHHHHHHHHQN